MRVAVTVGAVSEDSPWLADCLASLEGCRWPVVAHITRDWELATIGWAAERYDEFVFLPESTVVLDQSILDECFERWAGRSVNLGTAQGLAFRMYLGKYRGEVVRALTVPVVRGKEEAIMYEVTWCVAYAHADEYVSLGGPLEHTDVREERHGRTNMVVENEWLRKWKGTWR